MSYELSVIVEYWNANEQWSAFMPALLVPLSRASHWEGPSSVQRTKCSKAFSGCLTPVICTSIREIGQSENQIRAIMHYLTQIANPSIPATTGRRTGYAKVDA